jgi:FkbM family methyltransferase
MTVRHLLGQSPLGVTYRAALDYFERKKRCRFYRQFIKPGDLTFDIGANHGNRVDTFVTLGANVVAVEPQPKCLASLSRFANRPGVHVVNGVVSAEEGPAILHLSDDDQLSSLSDAWIESVMSSGRFGNTQWSGKLAVHATTLDALIRSYGVPAFIKIDVEGAEIEVLRGLSRWPKGLTAVSFEFTPERMYAAEACMDELKRKAPPGTCMVFNFSPNESMRLRFPTFVDGTTLVKELHTYEDDRRLFGDVYVSPQAAWMALSH